MNKTSEADHYLDVTGLYCPEPVMMLHNIINDMSAGAVVQVLATDPSTERDVPRFCTFLGHTLLSHEVREGTYIYIVQKSVED